MDPSIKPAKPAIEVINLLPDTGWRHEVPEDPGGCAIIQLVAGPHPSP